MGYIELNWDIFLRAIVPFGAANIFAMVLVYFTIVRFRIGQAYPFYAIFITCFIIFLCGPLINTMPIDASKRWFDIVRNIMLFSIGMPALLYALLAQANISLARKWLALPVILGLLWSLLFSLALPLNFYKPGELPWLYQFDHLKAKHIYFSQIALIAFQLFIPCLLLLRKKLKPHVVSHIQGVLTLCVFISIGNAFQQWEIYYAGSSLTALLWARAVYRDIQITNEKVNQHHKHQGSLAIAQYTAPSNAGFAEYYPAKLNEAYPFREREALVETVFTASSGLIDERLNSLMMALKTFTQNNVDTYKIRAKEVLFMLFDSVIYKCGNTTALINRLEDKGLEIDQATSLAVIDLLLAQEAKHLAQSIDDIPESEADNALVDRIKTYILAHYHKDIAIADIVDEIRASRSHIMKTFKNVTAQTINQYLTDVRINKAKDILLSKSVTEAAFEVGFNNSAYFSTAFKKHVGVSPKQFQQAAKSIPDEKTTQL